MVSYGLLIVGELPLPMPGEVAQGPSSFCADALSVRSIEASRDINYRGR